MLSGDVHVVTESGAALNLPEKGVHEEQTAGNLPSIGMQITQFSAMGFFPAAILASVLGRWLGFSIFFMNLLSTLWVHRLNRTGEVQRLDTIDEIAIFVWVVYNLFVTVQVCIALNDNFVLYRFLLLVFALIGAAGSGILDVKRRRLRWRTKRRNFIHIFMHLSGGVGSLLLMCATIGTDQYLL